MSMITGLSFKGLKTYPFELKANGGVNDGGYLECFVFIDDSVFMYKRANNPNAVVDLQGDSP